MDDYVSSVAGPSGAINQQEYDAIKAKALT
jgi:hypothetical protein